MLNNKNFLPPPKPQSWFEISILVLRTLLFAAYEEVLYRLYLPFRIKSFYGTNPEKFRTYFTASEVFPVIFFAAAHRYLGLFNVLYALTVGIIFRVLYFTLKKKIEIKIEQKKAIIIAALIVILIHSFNNLIVYLNFIF